MRSPTRHLSWRAGPPARGRGGVPAALGARSELGARLHQPRRPVVARGRHRVGARPLPARDCRRPGATCTPACSWRAFTSARQDYDGAARMCGEARADRPLHRRRGRVHRAQRAGSRARRARRPAMTRLRLLHAIHDFLPRHRAGSEIYAFELCRELSRRHDVFVVTTDYDLAAPHGTIRWRAYEGLPVIEIVNNWYVRLLRRHLRVTAHHVASWCTCWPRPRRRCCTSTTCSTCRSICRGAPASAGIATVATLHDYTLVCASGGQRLHVAESHRCDEIDPVRCSRCVGASPVHAQAAAARLSRGPAGALVRWAVPVRAPADAGAGATLPPDGCRPGRSRRRRSRDGWRAAARCSPKSICSSLRLRRLLPSTQRFGLDPRRIEVSDYGFAIEPPLPRPRPRLASCGLASSAPWPGTRVHTSSSRPRGCCAAPSTSSWPVTRRSRPSMRPACGVRRLALRCSFTGGFDRREMAQVYGGLDVLVVPSLWLENSPLVIHEAFMHGVAVVGSASGRHSRTGDRRRQRLHLRRALGCGAGIGAAALHGRPRPGQAAGGSRSGREVDCPGRARLGSALCRRSCTAAAAP